MEPEERVLDYDETLHTQWNLGVDTKGNQILIQYTMDKDSVEHFRFSHLCTLKRSGLVMRVAPDLQIGSRYNDAHKLLSISPIHIEPSVLCDDCGLHGYVRDGEWINV